MKTYLAKFDGLGYYAKHQPKYEWSFTDDIKKAMHYKTIDGVTDRLIHASRTMEYKKYTSSIVTLEEITNFKIISTVIFDKDAPTKSEIKRDLAYEKEREEVLKKLAIQKANQLLKS